MSDWDGSNSGYDPYSPQEGGYYATDESGVGRWTEGADPSLTKAPLGSAFDPSQVARTDRPNFEGTPTIYYDNSGSVIGTLNPDKTTIDSTSGNVYYDITGQNRIDTLNDPTKAYQQLKDARGNLMFMDESGGYTNRNTGMPALNAGSIQGSVSRNPRMDSSLWADPNFKMFLASAAAMAGGAALAPELAGAEAGAAGAGGWEGSAAAMEGFGGTGALEGSLAVPEGYAAAYEAALPASMEEMGALGAAEGSGALSGMSKMDMLKYGQKALGLAKSMAGSGGGGSTGGASPYAGLGGSSSALGGTTIRAPQTSALTNATNKIELPQFAQLKQLYPQLSNVQPEVLAALMGKQEQPQQQAQSASPYAPTQTAKSEYGNLVPENFATLKDGGKVPTPLSHATHVPEFITGATGHYVKGRGDGQSDDIPAMLADGEYVFDAETVAQLGNGSSDAGAKVLDKMRHELRAHKRSAPVDEIPPKSKSPLEYIKDGLKRK